MSSTCNSGSPGREAARSTGLFLDKKWKDEKKTQLCTLYIILWDAKVNWRITWVPDLCVCSQCQGRPRGWWSWRAWSAHGFEPGPETKTWSGSIFSLLASHLFDVTVKCGENGHVHDGAAKVDVDTDDHNPRYALCSVCSVCTIQLGIIRPYDDKTTVWTRRFPPPGTSFQDCQHFWEIGLADLVIGFYCRSLRKTINGQ